MPSFPPDAAPAAPLRPLRHPVAIPLLLLLAVALAYANSFPGVFIQDDLYIVRDNPLLQQFDLWRILRSEYWHGIESNGLYRPLTILSLALNRALLGTAPAGYHLVNLLLHAGVTLILRQLLLRWNFSPLLALLAALLFAVHPIHGEVVNIVVGRSELLAALFLLLALLAAGDQIGRGTYLAVGTSYLAALLSKEHAVALLLLLPLRDAFSAGALRPLRERFRLYALLLGITLAWLLWRRLGVLHEFPTTVLPPEVLPLAYLTWDGRFLSAAVLQGLYLLKLLFPVGLQAVYDASDLPPVIKTIASLRGMLVLAALGALLALIVRGWRRCHPLALFSALYLASFLLTANLLFPIGVTFAERLAYFPSVWFCAGVAVLADGVLQRQGVILAGRAAIAAALLLLTTLTVLRNPDFSSEERYWGADVRRNPDDLLALVKHAELHATAGRQGEAEAAFQRVIRLSPSFAYGLRSYAHYLFYLRRYDESMSLSGEALALARKRGDRTAMAHDLGDQARIHLERNEYAEALARLDESAQVLGREDFDQDIRARAQAGLGQRNGATGNLLPAKEPGAKKLYDLAVDEFRAGRLDAARSRLELLTQSGGGGAETWNLLGVVRGQLGDWPGAIAAFEEALRLAPGNRYYAENLQSAQMQRRE